LVDSVQRNLCTRIYCTTCGATEFRQGVFHALTTATRQQPLPNPDWEATARVAQALADVRPDNAEASQLESAARCLVFDVCRAIGESEAARILGDSWGGDVLRRMQEHYRAEVTARRAREEYESPTSVQKRREEKKRLAQERHQQRLALKMERDRTWRESQRKPAGHPDEDL